MKIKLIKGSYTNPLNCPIAKGLRRKLIFALVDPYGWHGLFLGVIPVSGPISEDVNTLAFSISHGECKASSVETSWKLGWRRYEIPTPKILEEYFISKVSK